MVIKLLPEQIAKLWKLIRLGIVGSFEVRSQATNDILQSYLVQLLTGERQCWALLNEERAIVGTLITRISVEALTGQRILSIDHIYAFEVLPESVWPAGWSVLEKFALSNKCKAIVAITKNQRVLQMSREFGFVESFYLVKEI